MKNWAVSCGGSFDLRGTTKSLCLLSPLFLLNEVKLGVIIGRRMLLMTEQFLRNIYIASGMKTTERYDIL